MKIIGLTREIFMPLLSKLALLTLPVKRHQELAVPHLTPNLGSEPIRQSKVNNNLDFSRLFSIFCDFLRLNQQTIRASKDKSNSK